MFSEFVCQIPLLRIRLKLREYVPDSGQEHTTNSNDSFFVSTASLDSEIAFTKFRMFFGFEQSICDLNKNRFKKRTGTGNAGRFNFLSTLIITRTTTSRDAEPPRAVT